eukprot:scaffold1190_cov393-Prasinococcus_capsulatus_cf.AAC.5
MILSGQANGESSQGTQANAIRTYLRKLCANVHTARIIMTEPPTMIQRAFDPLATGWVACQTAAPASRADSVVALGASDPVQRPQSAAGRQRAASYDQH